MSKNGPCHNEECTAPGTPTAIKICEGWEINPQRNVLMAYFDFLERFLHCPELEDEVLALWCQFGDPRLECHMVGIC